MIFIATRDRLEVGEKVSGTISFLREGEFQTQPRTLTIERRASWDEYTIYCAEIGCGWERGPKPVGIYLYAASVEGEDEPGS